MMIPVTAPASSRGSSGLDTGAGLDSSGPAWGKRLKPSAATKGGKLLSTLDNKPTGPIYFQRSTRRTILPLAAPRITVLQIIAACVLLDWATIQAGEPEPASVTNQDNQAKQTQTGGQSLSSVQGRQHPSYQIFAHQLALTPITVIDKKTLEIGGKLRIDMGQTNELSIEARKALAAEFEVPAGLVDKYLEHLGDNARWDAEQAAQELRMTVTDYKYLRDKWTQYHPATESQGIKTNALQALEVGATDKAWELYNGLPRPQPPSGLQIVIQK